MSNEGKEPGGSPATERRLMGSLRDALAAAGRSDPVRGAALAVVTPPPLPQASASASSEPPPPPRPPAPSAADAAREARGKLTARDDAADVDLDAPQTKVVRAPRPQSAASTQLIRGKIKVKRTDFFQDPVVGWLVIVGGSGLGAFRPIYEGNNTIGRGKGQRIPIDFGDDTISNEEQAYIRYDSVDRKFLLVPNLAKTNIVAVNDKKPTGAVELSPMDLITMGRTQLVFVPFCGNDFDWSEISDMKD